MAYEFKKEYSKWKKERQLEEELMRAVNFDSKKMNELYEFDLKQFNDDRSFHRNEFELFNTSAKYIEYKDPYVFDSFSKILDLVEEPKVYAFLKSLSKENQLLLLLRINGYTYEEIGLILGIHFRTAQARHKKIIKISNSLKK